MMTHLHSTRALLGTATAIAAADHAEAVEAGHVLRAIAHSDDDGAHALVERFPALAGTAPAPTPPGLVRRLFGQPKPSAPVRAAAERALAGASRAGHAPSPLDLVPALAEAPETQPAFAAHEIAPGALRTWFDDRRRAA